MNTEKARRIKFNADMHDTFPEESQDDRTALPYASLPLLRPLPCLHSYNSDNYAAQTAG